MNAINPDQSDLLKDILALATHIPAKTVASHLHAMSSDDLEALRLALAECSALIERETLQRELANTHKRSSS